MTIRKRWTSPILGDLVMVDGKLAGAANEDASSLLVAHAYHEVARIHGAHEARKFYWIFGREVCNGIQMIDAALVRVLKVRH